jgi:hypothetical protein
MAIQIWSIVHKPSKTDAVENDVGKRSVGSRGKTRKFNIVRLYIPVSTILTDVLHLLQKSIHRRTPILYSFLLYCTVTYIQ